MPMFKFNKTNKVLRPDGAIEKVTEQLAKVFGEKGYGEVIEPAADLTPPAEEKAAEEPKEAEDTEEANAKAAREAAAQSVTAAVAEPPQHGAIRRGRGKKITRNRNR